MLVVGALLAAMSLATDQYVSVVAGVVVLLLGVLTLVNAQVVVEPNEVQLRNPLGMTLKRYPVQSPVDLGFQGNALWHLPQNRKIVSLGFGYNKNDVAALRAQVPQR